MPEVLGMSVRDWNEGVSGERSGQVLKVGGAWLETQSEVGVAKKCLLR